MIGGKLYDVYLMFIRCRVFLTDLENGFGWKFLVYLNTKEADEVEVVSIQCLNSSYCQIVCKT